MEKSLYLQALNCHDSVTVGLCAQVCLLNSVAIVFRDTAVILLANLGELYKSSCTVAYDLWQCKQASSSGYVQSDVTELHVYRTILKCILKYRITEIYRTI